VPNVKYAWMVSLAIAFFASFASNAHAQTTDHLRNQLDGVSVTERLGASLPRDLVLTDERGIPSTVTPQNRPLLLTLNYVHCKMLCSLQLAGLAKALKTLRQQAGQDFDIVTVSIDPKDTAIQALRMKQKYVGQAGGTENLERGWRFMVGSENNVRAIADAVGFHYRFDPEIGDYRHQATLVVISTDGRVSSYLHGIDYDTTELQNAIDRASRAEVSTAKNGIVGVLMNCFRYDPSKKTPIGLVVMRAGGVVVILFLAGLFGANVLRGRRLKAQS